MPKTQVPSDELETLIVQAVRRHDQCQGFQSIQLCPVTDGHRSNWRTGDADYGTSAQSVCDEALRDVLPQMQEDYDLTTEVIG